MKIYVVTRGAYSSYHICGAFTDKEKAQKLVDYINFGNNSGWDLADIEEYEDNAWDEALKVGGFYRVVLYSDGRIWADRQECDIECCYKESNLVKRSPFGPLITYVLAKDEYHAKKIASDLFAKYTAEKEGL